ncbi:MAG: hypothetical protein Q8K94_00310 [Moraxellaceae bacterium]|nr:hypothetical protein [Moraxellaceae bacterium]MDP1775036.1 hypothetical protein [Moraxellaceae bacterium]
MNRYQTGFSLIELLLLLALMGSMWWAASYYQQQSQQVAQARQWTQAAVVALQSVRLRALSEQRIWRVCGGDFAADCSSPWAIQWWAYTEAEAAVMLQPDIPKGWRVYWRGFRQRSFIEWTAEGDAADSNGTLTLCAPIAQDAALRQIVISRSGRLRIQVPQAQGSSALASARAVCGW